MATKKLTGWGIKGRPFSKSEFDRSWIKTTTTVKTYPNYLKAIAKTLASRNVKLKNSLKQGMK